MQAQEQQPPQYIIKYENGYLMKPFVDRKRGVTNNKQGELWQKNVFIMSP